MSFIYIEPLSGFRIPLINDNRVDFPQPDGPTIDTNCPAFTSKLTSDNAFVSPDKLWYE